MRLSGRLVRVRVVRRAIRSAQFWHADSARNCTAQFSDARLCTSTSRRYYQSYQVVCTDDACIQGISTYDASLGRLAPENSEVNGLCPMAMHCSKPIWMLSFDVTSTIEEVVVMHEAEICGAVSAADGTTSTACMEALDWGYDYCEASADCDPLEGVGGDNTCIFANDGECDDGRPDAECFVCGTCDFGTDASDCNTLAADYPLRPTEYCARREEDRQAAAAASATAIIAGVAVGVGLFVIILVVSIVLCVCCCCKLIDRSPTIAPAGTA